MVSMFKNYFRILYTCMHAHVHITTKMKSFILIVCTDICANFL